MILIASVNGTMPTVDLLKKGFLEFYLQDTLLYEPQKITAFIEDPTKAQTYINALISKLRNLDMFKRYVLMQFCFDFWEKYNNGANLDEYVKGCFYRLNTKVNTQVNT